MTYAVFVVAIFLFQFVHVALPCNNFGVKVVSVLNGNQNTNCWLEPNVQITLDDDCKVKISCCLNVHKGFEQAVVSFDVVKGLLVQRIPNQDICQGLNNIGGKLKCPFNPGRYCFFNETAYDVTPMKQFLPMILGNVRVKNLQLVYNGGSLVDQFEIVLNFFRKRSNTFG